MNLSSAGLNQWHPNRCFMIQFIVWSVLKNIALNPPYKESVHDISPASSFLQQGVIGCTSICSKHQNKPHKRQKQSFFPVSQAKWIIIDPYSAIQIQYLRLPPLEGSVEYPRSRWAQLKLTACVEVMLAGKGNHIAILATDVLSLGAKSRSGKVPIKSLKKW